MLERGGMSVILSYERALPLLGFGCVLALMRPWQAALGAVLVLLGLWLGFVAREWLIAALVSGSKTAGRLGLPGPISCLAGGLVLAISERHRPWLLPPMAIIIGAMLAIAIKLVDPSFHDPNFIRGAIAASVWLVAVPALTGRRLDWPWFRIAIRILGSWLIAIGLMLGASILIPRPSIGVSPQQLPQSLERPRSPSADPSPSDTDRPQLPPPPPGFDSLHQL
jgi:hypothetical protein